MRQKICKKIFIKSLYKKQLKLYFNCKVKIDFDDLKFNCFS